MFDVLTEMEEVQVAWLKKGAKQTDAERQNLSILLDLGALDSFELFQTGQQRLVLLTEDSKSSRLAALLEANGLPSDEYFTQPLHGVDNLSAAVPVADFFTRQGDNTCVIVHRDGDGMTEAERTWWSANEAAKLPDRSFPFLTPLTDVEHSFCQPAHIAAVYGMTIEQAQALVDQAIAAQQAKLTIEFSNKRNALKSGALKKMEAVQSAQDLIGASIQFPQVKGKTLLKAIHAALQSQGLNAAHLSTQTSPALVDVNLSALIVQAKLAAGLA